jgi:WD40 repeat protein
VTSKKYGTLTSDLSQFHKADIQADHSAELVWHGFEPNTGRLLSVAEDGRIVARASGSAPEQVIDAHEAPAVTAAMSPQGDLLATCDRSGRIRIWKLPEFGSLQTIENRTVPQRLQFSPDGRQLMSLDAAGQLTLRTSQASQTTQSLAPAVIPRIRFAVWSPAGDRLLLAEHPEGGAVSLRMIDPAREFLTTSRLDYHGPLPQCAAFAPDGEQVAVVAADGSLQVFSSATGRRRILPETPSKVLDALYSPDGAKLVLTCPSCLLVRDSTTQQDLLRYEFSSSELRSIDPLADAASGKMSPDGRFIIGFSDRHSAICWPLNPLEWAEQQFSALVRPERMSGARTQP